MISIDWNTVIGAFIGAGGSIVGGLWATRRSIRNERRLKSNQEVRQTKLSAAILKEDINGMFLEMMYFAQNNKFQGYASHNAEYSYHISNISKHLNSVEIFSLNQLYGFIQKHQKITMGNLNHDTYFYSELKLNLNKFIDAVFGNKDIFLRLIPANITSEIMNEEMKNNMVERFRKAITKLDDIKSK